MYGFAIRGYETGMRGFYEKYRDCFSYSSFWLLLSCIKM